MKRLWKRLLTMVLCVTMTAQLIPSLAYAGTVDPDNSVKVYDTDMLEQLEEWGVSEEEAEYYYDLMQDYGFLDEDGGVVESWDIIMDGEKVSADEVRQMLDDPFTDLSKTVTVDGTTVTLEDLQTMIAIEDYIQYLYDTYYTEQDWTAEEIANLYSLVDQINTEGLASLSEDGSFIGSTGVNHGIRLNVDMTLIEAEDEDAEDEEVPDEEEPDDEEDSDDEDEEEGVEIVPDEDGFITVGEGDKVTFTVTPTGEQGQDITFAWRTVDGSARAEALYVDGEEVIPEDEEDEDETDSQDAQDGDDTEAEDEEDEDARILEGGTITIPAGSTDPVELTVEIGEVPGRVDGTGTLIVQLFDVTNALFVTVDEVDEVTESSRWEQKVAVETEEEFLLRAEETINLSYQGDYIAVCQADKNDNGHYSWDSYYGRYSSLLRTQEGEYVMSAINSCCDSLNVGTSLIGGASSVTSEKPLEEIIYTNYKSVQSTFYIEVEGDNIVGKVTTNKMFLDLDLPFDTWQHSHGSTVMDNGLFAIYYDVKKTYTDNSLTTLEFPSIEYKVSNSDNYTSKNWTIAEIPVAYNNVSGSASLGDVALLGMSGWDLTKEHSIVGNVTDYYLQNLDPGNQVFTFTVTVPNVLYKGYYTDNDWKNYTMYYMYYPNVDADITLSLWDDTQATDVTLSAPAGTYYAGQTIPITATFDYPMEISEDMYITVNYQQLAPVEVGTVGISCTFLYEVMDIDNTTVSLTGDEVVTGDDGTQKYDLDGVGANGIDIEVTMVGDAADTGKICEDVCIDTPDKESAIDGIYAEITDPVTNPVLEVTLAISDDEYMTLWLVNDMDFDQESGIWTAQSLTILYNGVEYPLTTTADEITGGTLTASIPISVNSGDEPIMLGAELLIDGEISFPLYVTVEQDPAIFITEDDISAMISVTLDGDDYIYADESYTIYVQDSPTISASFKLAEDDFSFGDTSEVTVLKSDGSLDDPDADFVWWIGDEDQNIKTTYANIDEEGDIIPTGSAGTAYVYITALNGDNKTEDEESDKAVTVAAYQLAVMADEEGELTDPVTLGYLNFGVGLTPFLSIPYSEISSVSEQDVTIYWTSNLCDKNGDEETVFAVSVTRSEESVYSTEVPGTAEDPASGVTIPGEFLTYDYYDKDNNSFTVTVSSEYEEVLYEASAVITLQPSPAVVSFDSLDSYYITDTAGSVNISWNISNFDYYDDSGDDLFLFLVTKDGETICSNADDPGSTVTGSGRYSGSYTLPISNVAANSSDVNSYREIYTVSIAAKNGSDSTWSYDSFMLYVYDRDALDIWINGESASGVTLSNVQTISEMSQEQILALNRDINLKAMVSINYGDYAWSELSDQIAWASSNSSVASVNYQQGTLYENIENYSYTSYRPNTELGISGVSDGQVTVTATHTLTGISDSITVDVERLDNRLYEFQCYPQATTTLIYTNGDGEEKTVTSDETGAVAVYEESGIVGEIYCQSEYEGYTYLGTFYGENMTTGEGDWTLLERYPCNNLTLRRAAYAYVYLKTPDGEPYTGSVTVRGGVYVDGEYIKDALFDYNGAQNGDATQPGYEDYTVDLGSDGKLEITMDQTQWGFVTGAVNPWNEISYTFEISMGDDQTKYYPMFVFIDATATADNYVENGEAIVTFRANSGSKKHPFIINQLGQYGGGSLECVLDDKIRIGPITDYPTSEFYTLVMWWGEEDVGDEASLQLYTSDGVPLSDMEGKYEISNESYPFTDDVITTYVVTFDEESLDGILESSEYTGMYLDYYKDGSALTRRETLPQTLVNMIGVEMPEGSQELLDEILNMGNYSGTDASAANSMGFGDAIVGAGITLMAGDSYTKSDTSAFSMKLASTSDPTKFMGFVQLNVGSMNDKDQVTGVYGNSANGADKDYVPGLNELLLIAGKKSVKDYFTEDLNKVMNGKSVRSIDFGFSGYLETLIYYDFNVGKWRMQVIDGGFGAGGGANWTWTMNTIVGIVPVTASLTLGGTAEVDMDATSVAYKYSDGETALGVDYLTELRLYLYLKFFAGVGFDYAVIAAKIGLYGQIDLDMRFDWLNRPTTKEGMTSTTYPSNNDSVVSGQEFKMDGQTGIEFIFKFLFVKYEKILCSWSFKLFDETTGQWTTVNNIWDADQAALSTTLSLLSASGSVSLDDIGGGMQMVSLNMAPTMEDVSYLKSGSEWDSGIRTLALDNENGLAMLNENAYEYAEPTVTDDGSIVAFLGVPESYTGGSDIESSDVSAMYAVKAGDAYVSPAQIDDGEGFGDSELSIDGTGNFAVAAWTRQTVDIDKDDGAVLTDADQRMMMEGTDICVSVYEGGSWTTTLIENGGADLAPVVATNGNRAVVAWRSVAGNDEDITDFNQSDMILYKIYDYDEETKEYGWGETQTLYNGTSGNVKGITADMMSNGTAAVAYALDVDGDTSTITDREMVYAVINNETGEVDRNVRATNDNYLDENPQLTTVSIGGQERFLLGWYTEQSVDDDSAGGLDGNDGSESTATTTSDIRLIDFDSAGNATQQMPDSISEAASSSDVSITSEFAFSKGAGSIDELSVVWVERSESEVNYIDEDAEDDDDSDEEAAGEVEKDVLKAVKFYTYGQNNEIVSFTGAVDLAEMPDETLIDSFDAYAVGGTGGDEIKAVIQGTSYGVPTDEYPDGTVTKVGEASGGETVAYTVPNSMTNMFTATESYENAVDVPAFLPDYDTLKLGAKTEVWFSIDNKGVDPITSLSINVGGTVTDYTGLNILPGGNLQVYADYQVPSDALKDENFTVTATFLSGGTYTYEGLIYMNLPELQVANASIIREEDGERDILIKLNNGADAALGDSSNTRVRVSFYTDATYENEIPGGYGLEAFEITDAADLKMIDEGGYSKMLTFDVESYLADYAVDENGNPAPVDGAIEIPNSGMCVYIMAEVIDNETGEAQGEPDDHNNYGMVTCENLKVRTGEDVTITTTLDVSEDEGASDVTVTVELQNTRLTETTTGNVIVTLLGEDGTILAQQQSYNGIEGLLTLGGEQKAVEVFTFSGITDVFTVDVQYTDMILEADEDEEIPEGLESLSFPSLDGNISIDDFVWDEDLEAYVYEVTVDTLYSLSVIAVARDADATITVNGGNSYSYSLADNVELVPGKANVIEITVNNRNGAETTYILTVNDETAAVAGSAAWDDDDDRDGIRPRSITVHLYSDGDEIDSVVVTAADGWSWNFTNLPIYSDGAEIEYTISQDGIEGYETVVSGYDVTNIHIPDSLEITGSKSWDDNEDQDGVRPGSITVRLLADGVETDSRTVTAADGWSFSFAGLPEYRDGGVPISYTVTEDAIDGYYVSYAGDSFINTHSTEQTGLTVSAAWDDDGDRDGLRPESITVQLYADGDAVEGATLTLTAAGGWIGSFTGLDIYRDGGKQIEYTVEAVEDADGYTSAVTGDAQTGYVVMSTHEIELIDVEGTKSWDDAEDQDGARPESITVNLLADGETIDRAEVAGGTQGLFARLAAFFSSGSDEWSYGFTGLPKYRDGGVEIEYTISENAVSGYETQISGYDVINTHTPEKITFDGGIAWYDDDDRDGLRPESVTVHLYAGSKEAGSVTVTAADGWAYSFTDLDKYSDGEEIAYTVRIDKLDGYETTVEGGRIVNSHTTAATEVAGTKSWDDAEDQDGLRPGSITVRLLADGEETASAAVSASDAWSYSFTDLPIYRDGGVEIAYTVTEDAVEGYDTAVDGYDITNTHVPATVDITGTKSWDDVEDQDGARPQSITVRLLADGKETASETVSASEGWIYSFDDMPVYRDGGVEIVYTVTEDAIEDYSAEYDGNDMTNTHTAGRTSLTVSAFWDDDSNRDGERPESITVQLYADGEAVEGATLTLCAENGWTGTFTELDVYRDGGKQIEYTVEVADETENVSYMITGDAQTGYVITGEHEIETVEVSGTKSWDDAEDQDGLRPESITVNLLADGELADSVIVTGETQGFFARLFSGSDDGSDVWNYSFTDLPKYRDGGVEIAYAVCEEAVEGYTVAYDGYDITNTHTLAVPDIPDEDTPDEDTPDEDNPDEDTPDEDISDEDIVEGEITDDRSLTENTSDGEQSDNDQSAVITPTDTTGGNSGGTTEGTAEETAGSETAGAKTADNNTPLLYMWLILIAGAAAVITGVRRRTVRK